MIFNAIDLFAGCGGLTEGFLQTGKFKTLAAIDWEQQAVNTLKFRLKNKWKYKSDQNIIYFDLQRTSELLNGYSDLKYGKSKGLNHIIGKKKVDLIIGGPPCQAYSIAGRVRDKNGMQNDYRNFLFESYVELVNEFSPKAFIFENVEGILTSKPGGVSIINRIKKGFRKIGYNISEDLREQALFDTSFYNVPQKRKRVIIFGVRTSNNSSTLIDDFYSKMKQKATLNPLNSKIAFKNLPKIYPKKVNDKVCYITEKNNEYPKNHEPRRHSERDMDIFRLLADDIKQGVEKYSSTKELIKLYKEKTGKESKFHKYHVIREDRPSNTIPAHLYKDGLRHIHPDPEQARSITPREAARLQSFDDDFEFLGSRSDQFKMIGNAVPPKFSKIIAETILELNIN